MNKEMMTIREMCDAFGVSLRTLRFYESRHLLSPMRQGQRRFYDRRDRARLKLILRGKRFGMSLGEIQQLLDLYDPDTDNHAQLCATLAAAETRLADFIQQQAELAQVIDDLRDQIGLVRHQLAQTDPSFTSNNQEA